MAARHLLFALLVLTFLAGCAESRDPADISIKSHPPEWLKPDHPDFHGTKVARDTPEGCQSCHGADYRGAGRAPSCYACHNGPSGHPEAWGTREPKPFHGDDVIANEGYSRCAACHGEDYRGGWSLTSCYACHAGPSGHPRGWMTPSTDFFHGKEVATEGTSRCMDCHGDDLRGGWSQVSCYNQCHVGPSGHPRGWLDPASDEFHGTRVASEGVDGCRVCHGEDLQGGTSGVSCTNYCHAGPGGHPSGWVNPTSNDFHGNEVAENGTDRCKACHGEDLLGGWSGVSCTNVCHAGPGGHPSGWVNPTSSEFHGARVAAEGPDDCMTCHGTDLRGGWSGISCYNVCHATPSGHPTGWLNAGSPDFHGAAVAAEGLDGCRDCHGADLLGGWTGVSCTNACHPGPSGHPMGWLDDQSAEFHGAYVAGETNDGCRLCHGTDFRGGWSEVSCYGGCHDGPSGHSAGWMVEGSGEFHGDYVINHDAFDCMPCHGEDLRGGWSGVSCYNICHEWGAARIGGARR